MIEVSSYVMKVSRNGQVSIPAEARRRWKAEKMIVVDLGDRIVMRPFSDDARAELMGKYKGRGPTTDEARAQERAEDAERERRRYGT
jgi:bifunctional DNA-binding transcriptional regulator/antitoxin component of YhaV-PrlF toxin-antitoxin module